MTSIISSRKGSSAINASKHDENQANQYHEEVEASNEFNEGTGQIGTILDIRTSTGKQSHTSSTN